MANPALRRLLARLLGERLFYTLGYYYLLKDAPFRESARVLDSLQDRYRGKRCFILGNGPSLRRMDLSPLKDEVTFGLNRIYLLFSELGFQTTFYLAVNKLVVEQCAGEIATQVQGVKFISYDARRWLSGVDNLVYLYSREGPRFYPRPARGVWQGATVTYVALQLAYAMGFDQVFLIGVDHAYTAAGEPHQTVVSPGADPNHFDQDYFGKGFRWQLPDLALSEQAYRLARQAFEQDGRVVLDATLQGKLQVFPKVDYWSLFGNA